MTKLTLLPLRGRPPLPLWTFPLSSTVSSSDSSVDTGTVKINIKCGYSTQTGVEVFLYKNICKTSVKATGET